LIFSNPQEKWTPKCEKSGKSLLKISIDCDEPKKVSIRKFIKSVSAKSEGNEKFVNNFILRRVKKSTRGVSASDS
jgi:hypothetical protein